MKSDAGGFPADHGAKRIAGTVRPGSAGRRGMEDCGNLMKLRSVVQRVRPARPGVSPPIRPTTYPVDDSTYSSRAEFPLACRKLRERHLGIPLGHLKEEVRIAEYQMEKHSLPQARV